MSYYVTAAEQARRDAERARARAVEDVRQLRGKCGILLKECRRRVALFGEVFDPGVAVPERAGVDDVSALTSEARQLQAVLAGLGARAEEQVRLARVDFLQRAVAGGLGGSAVRSVEVVAKRLVEHGRDAGEREAAAASWREGFLATVGRVASADRIPLEVTKQELETITSASSAATAAVAQASTTHEAKLAIMDLRHVVSEVHASCKERRERDRLRKENLEEVARLRLEVAGVDGPSVDGVLGMLDEAERDPDRPLSPTLVALVENAVRQHEAEGMAAHAAHVRDELAEVFEDLGLVVLAGFEIEFAEADTLVFKRPGWDRHAVMASVDGQGRAGFKLIREAQGEGAGVDTLSPEYEKELCDQVMPKIDSALADRGIHLDCCEIVMLADGHSLIEVGEGTLSAAVLEETPPSLERASSVDGQK